MLREVQVFPVDDGVQQQALAGPGYQLPGAGGVNLLVAPVPDGVGEPVGAFAFLWLKNYLANLQRRLSQNVSA